MGDTMSATLKDVTATEGGQKDMMLLKLRL